jgi:glutamate synthase (NADPH/NADH) large chain
MAQDVSASDLDWKIAYDMQRCTLCGSCIAACTFGAIEAGVLRLDQAEGSKPFPGAGGGCRTHGAGVRLLLCN